MFSDFTSSSTEWTIGSNGNLKLVKEIVIMWWRKFSFQGNEIIWKVYSIWLSWMHPITCDSHPAGTVRHPNQSWTNIICSGPNQFWTNPEPILLIPTATVRLWFTYMYVHTYLFTFWFSRTNPESKMPAGQLMMVKIYKFCSKVILAFDLIDDIGIRWHRQTDQPYSTSSSSSACFRPATLCE